MKNCVYFLFVVITAISCNPKEKGIFPEKKNVTELEQTDFVPTLESSFGLKNNIIYGATIPFAWHEVRKEIGSTLKTWYILSPLLCQIRLTAMVMVLII